MQRKLACRLLTFLPIVADPDFGCRRLFKSGGILPCLAFTYLESPQWHLNRKKPAKFCLYEKDNVSAFGVKQFGRFFCVYLVQSLHALLNYSFRASYR